MVSFFDHQGERSGAETEDSRSKAEMIHGEFRKKTSAGERNFEADVLLIFSGAGRWFSESGPDHHHPAVRDRESPGQETEPPRTGVSQGCGCEYAAYLAMSPGGQQAYYESFSSPEAFIAWSQSARAAHEGHDDSVRVEGGDLNIGDYIG